MPPGFPGDYPLLGGRDDKPPRAVERGQGPAPPPAASSTCATALAADQRLAEARQLLVDNAGHEEFCGS